MNHPRATLLVSTYNMPRHLELVLEGIKRQSSRDFELIICDDGSDHQTKDLVHRFQESAPFSVKSVWHENQGFRKCKILNEGLRQAVGETLIFLDGDCIPHRDFVLDHLNQQEPGRYLAGRRVELDQKISEKITPEAILNGFFDFPRSSLILSALLGKTEFLNRSVRISHPLLRKTLSLDQVTDLKGCNYSVARKDLEAINGFDEQFEGYGREDTDVELRLQNLGLKIKSLKGLALQFHVWHPRREFTPKNDTRLEELRKSGRVTCSQGLRPTPQY